MATCGILCLNFATYLSVSQMYSIRREERKSEKVVKKEREKNKGRRDTATFLVPQAKVGGFFGYLAQ